MQNTGPTLEIVQIPVHNEVITTEGQGTVTETTETSVAPVQSNAGTETTETTETTTILPDFSEIIIGRNSKKIITMDPTGIIKNRPISEIETVTMEPSGMTITKRPNSEIVTMNMGKLGMSIKNSPNSETVKMQMGPLGMTIKTQ